MITLVKETHTYIDEKGTIIKGVTTILKDAGLINVDWFTQDSREKGSAVHELAARFANGERYDDKGREIAGLEYLNALEAWFVKTGAYPLATENMIDHTVNGIRYAGTYDLLADIKGKRWLVDYKTGAEAKWHKAQLAAYALKVNPDYCATIHICANGRYRERVLRADELLEGIAIFKDALAGA
jgi:hypothetical protein